MTSYFTTVFLVVFGGLAFVLALPYIVFVVHPFLYFLLGDDQASETPKEKRRAYLRRQVGMPRILPGPTA